MFCFALFFHNCFKGAMLETSSAPLQVPPDSRGLALAAPCCRLCLASGHPEGEVSQRLISCLRQVPLISCPVDHEALGAAGPTWIPGGHGPQFRELKAVGEPLTDGGWKPVDKFLLPQEKSSKLAVTRLCGVPPAESSKRMPTGR